MIMGLDRTYHAHQFIFSFIFYTVSYRIKQNRQPTLCLAVQLCFFFPPITQKTNNMRVTYCVYICPTVAVSCPLLPTLDLSVCKIPPWLPFGTILYVLSVTFLSCR